MRRLYWILPTVAALCWLPSQVVAQVNLGTAGNFAVLAGSTVTNTGPSIIDGGDIGVSPGTAITGFPPGQLVAPFVFRSADAVTLQAKVDLTLAWTAASLLPMTQNLTGQNLGGLTLQPGVYFFASSSALTGTLTLDNLGDPNAQFIFQIGSTLTTASNSAVVSINGPNLDGCNVLWQIGSSATLGTNTAFQGHLMAFTSITMNTGATIFDGSALAMNGAVTLDTNSIMNCIVAVPEPTTMAMLFSVGAAAAVPTVWKRVRSSKTWKTMRKEPLMA